MAKNTFKPRWAQYPGAARHSGLSTRLLEELVKEGIIVSSLVRRPGRTRGVRLIDLHSLDAYIESGVGGKTDMTVLQRKSKGAIND